MSPISTVLPLYEVTIAEGLAELELRRFSIIGARAITLVLSFSALAKNVVHITAAAPAP